MERLVQVDRDQLASELRVEMEQALARVMDAVNAAKDGRLIEDSELPVFQLMKELESRVFQKALQLRVDSTESSFSPSQGPGGEVQAEQGTRSVFAADYAGPGERAADAVLRPGRRQRRAGGQAGR
jgi:hypothetical protein